MLCKLTRARTLFPFSRVEDARATPDFCNKSTNNNEQCHCKEQPGGEVLLTADLQRCHESQQQKQKLPNRKQKRKSRTTSMVRLFCYALCSHLFLLGPSLSSISPVQSYDEKPASYLGAIREAESSPIREDSSFCHGWDPSVANNRSLQPFDVWLTHHPTWVVSNETDERFCVEPGNKHDHPYIRRLLQFYANQFHSSCERVHIRTM